MRNPAMSAKLLRSTVAALVLTTVSGCGGGGSGGMISTPNPAPAPTPTPTPTPVPTPTPAPSSSFDTREYRQSDGPEFHGAITAWQQGATGTGSIIAVVDTGIDRDSPEFAGRLHSASQDVVASRGVDAQDDHGTNVAMVAAAARDGVGILGVAFDAQVLALRADAAGTCGTETPEDPTLGCAFFDADIARGIDIAVDSGATVVNLSLGGDGASNVLLDAVRRASAAGVVVVVASGNYGDGSDPAFDRFQPTPFAAELRQAGGNNVIIVGSVDEAGTVSSFSNRAGSEAEYYLSARGERICCVYENGQIYVETDSTGSYTYLFSGTSFAAPQVAGAVALIRQAFPNLTGSEIVQLLLESARDAGDPGTDTNYGRGILDIARAFQPSGTMRIAGTTLAVMPGNPTGLASAAMGDALANSGPISTIGLDKYDRAYRVDLAPGFRSASHRGEILRGALMPGGRRLSGGQKGVSLAFTVRDPRHAQATYGTAGQLQLTAHEAEQASVLAGRIVARLSSKVVVGLAIRESDGSLSAQLRGARQPAFLIAGQGAAGLAGSAINERAVAISWTISGGNASISSEFGRVGYSGSRLGDLRFGPEGGVYPYRSLAFDYDRKIGNMALSGGFKWLKEDATVFGGWFGGTLGGSGSETLFLRASAQYGIAGDWLFGANAVYGISRANVSGLVGSGSAFGSSSWSIDLQRKDVLTHGDSLGLRIAQPLRVENGGLSLDLPVDFDYMTETPTSSRHLVSLTPSGRELVGEVRWAGSLGPGLAGASVYYRRDPGHITNTADDVGVALAWSLTF